MSIFKESFRDYVQQQLKLREAIVSLGNEGGGRMNNSKTVNLPKGKEVNIPTGAFYTNTVGRSCVIRMSSGVDLKPIEIVGESEIRLFYRQSTISIAINFIAKANARKIARLKLNCSIIVVSCLSR